MFAHVTGPGIIESVAFALLQNGVDLAALGVAWARALPTVILVPAFGLRALPWPLRFILGGTIAVAIFPALVPLASSRAHEPWILLALEEALRGVPIAIATAVPLWAATMAGGAIDTARGREDSQDVPVVEEGATEIGILFSLLASALFLSLGGPARVATSLQTAEFPAHPLIAAAHDITNGIAAAVAIAAPILAATIVIDVGLAITNRAASSPSANAITLPARSLGIVVMLALVFERIARLLALTQH
jgi:type III secretory pathway component EscT